MSFYLDPDLKNLSTTKKNCRKKYKINLDKRNFFFYSSLKLSIVCDSSLFSAPGNQASIVASPGIPPINIFAPTISLSNAIFANTLYR